MNRHTIPTHRWLNGWAVDIALGACLILVLIGAYAYAQHGDDRSAASLQQPKAQAPRVTLLTDDDLGAIVKDAWAQGMAAGQSTCQAGVKL